MKQSKNLAKPNSGKLLIELRFLREQLEPHLASRWLQIIEDAIEFVESTKDKTW